MLATATLAPAEERVVLRNISWQTYQRLLSETVNVVSTRFFYDEGNLEIMVVHAGHEWPNDTLLDLAKFAALETIGDFVCTGHMTCIREDLAKGFEPDSSFYLRRADEVRGRDKIDVAKDPPPELIVEVDITSSSLNHSPLYAAVGILEIWRFDGQRVRFHRLEGGEYHEIELSVALPPMTAAQATIFVERKGHQRAGEWERAVRQWIRSRTVASE